MSSVLLIKNDMNCSDIFFKKIFNHSYIATTIKDAKQIISSIDIDAIIWDADIQSDFPYSYFKEISEGKVLVLLISTSDANQLKVAMNFGFRFCIDKRSDPILMHDMVFQVYQAAKKCKHERHLLNRFTLSKKTREILASKYCLSNREIEVLNNSLDSCDYGQIASRLYISKGTVKRHLHNIYQKTEIGNRNELMSFVYGLNTLEISSFQNFVSMT